MTCCTSEGVLLHYTGENATYFINLEPAMKGRLLTSIASISSDDPLLSLSEATVLTVDTADYDQQGNAVTIPAYQGLSFRMSAGTAGSEDDEYTSHIVVSYVIGSDTKQQPVKVKVLNA